MMYVLRIPAGAIIWCQFMHMSTYKSWKQRLQTRKKALFNSRPLTEVSSSSNDLKAITPNGFLISRANPVPPCVVFTDKEIFCLERYLPTLIERKKKKLIIPQTQLILILVVVACAQTSPAISFASRGKGRLRNAVSNPVHVYPAVSA